MKFWPWRVETFVRSQIVYAAGVFADAVGEQLREHRNTLRLWQENNGRQFGVTIYGAGLERVKLPQPDVEAVPFPFVGLTDGGWAETGRLGWLGDVQREKSRRCELTVQAPRPMRVQGVFTFGEGACLTGWFHGQDLLLSSVCRIPWSDRGFELLELDQRNLVLQPGDVMRFTLERL